MPDNAPIEYKSRAILWNAVERVEKAKNSQLAREIEIALPIEFDYMQNVNLVREYVKKNFVAHGMCADIAIHNPNGTNPHAHIMLTMRPLNKDKTWGDKQKKVYNLDKDGNKIYDPKKRQYKCGKIQTTDWNEQTKAEDWRAAWADITNEYLELCDITEQDGTVKKIDHRSFERQGITDQIPTIHLGVAAHQMEQRGIRTERGDINRAIKLANEKIRNINISLLKLENELRKIEQQADEPEPQKQVEPTPTTPPTKAKPTQTPKPKPKPRTLHQVEIEIDIIDTKLQRLEHAESVIMSYNYKIDDIRRNLHTVGFFERRKMQKEILSEEQKRNSYGTDADKKYGNRPQLESKKSKLLKEKKQIEDATGVTAAREREQQKKRDEVIRQQQERDRYNAERKAKRLANPNKNKHDMER